MEWNPVSLLINLNVSTLFQMGPMFLFRLLWERSRAWLKVLRRSGAQHTPPPPPPPSHACQLTWQHTLSAAKGKGLLSCCWYSNQWNLGCVNCKSVSICVIFMVNIKYFVLPKICRASLGPLKGTFKFKLLLLLISHNNINWSDFNESSVWILETQT